MTDVLVKSINAHKYNAKQLMGMYYSGKHSKKEIADELKVRAVYVFDNGNAHATEIVAIIHQIGRWADGLISAKMLENYIGNTI